MTFAEIMAVMHADAKEIRNHPRHLKRKDGTGDHKHGGRSPQVREGMAKVYDWLAKQDAPRPLREVIAGTELDVEKAHYYLRSLRDDGRVDRIGVRSESAYVVSGAAGDV